jgi:hypothetical protein
MAHVCVTVRTRQDRLPNFVALFLSKEKKLCCLVGDDKASVFGWTCTCAGRRRFEILARLAMFSIGLHAHGASYYLQVVAVCAAAAAGPVCSFRSRPRFFTLY